MIDLRNIALESCDLAKQGGFPLFDDVGDLIGRGFADVGWELFLVLPGGALLSMLTGERSQYQAADRPHYFSVPNVERVVHELESRGYQLGLSERIDARSWRIVLVDSEGKERILESSEFLFCLLKFFANEIPI